MKYLYTKKPDDHCHEFEPGIYGRPAHTTEQPKLRKAGWVDSIAKLKGADHGLRKEEGREEKEVNGGDYAVWADLYEEKFGKRPHHKAKLETIKSKVESDD
jgi:hypothetical protein